MMKKKAPKKKAPKEVTEAHEAKLRLGRLRSRLRRQAIEKGAIVPRPRKETTPERHARWRREGYTPVFLRVRDEVVEVLDAHVRSTCDAARAVGWPNADKYSRTDAILDAVRAHYGLVDQAQQPVGQVQLVLPKVEP